MDTKINILFTSVGRRVALLNAFRSAYKELGLIGSIVAVDCDPMAPGLKAADGSYLVPQVSSCEYVPSLEKILRLEQIDAVFPLIDPDVPVLARNREVLESSGAKLAVFHEEAAEVVDDKLRTAELFRKCNLAIPKTWLPQDQDWLKFEFPMFIKPRSGSAAKHTFKVNNVRELAFFVDHVPDPIVQEFLDGPEVTSDVVCDLDGKLLSIVSRERITVRGGEVNTGRTLWDEEIADACKRLVVALDAKGPFTVQCMMHHGKPHFTEINPRFGGGAPAGFAAGCDSPRLLLSRLAGIPIDLPPLGAYRRTLGFARYEAYCTVEPGESVDSTTQPQSTKTSTFDRMVDAESGPPKSNIASSEDSRTKSAASSRERIYLSPPHMSPRARDLLLEAFDSNWIAPLGPHVDAFEQEFAAKLGIEHAVALSSGTAALHLAMLALGIGPGDEVATASLTFAATANAIRYVGAVPVFIDSEQESWNLDPNLLAQELESSYRLGKPIKAVIAVDVFGQCADYHSIGDLCRFYEIPLIEDAAESLGANYAGRAAGTLGDIGCFSFNGNKIITTSGGGMLVTNRKEWADRARHLACQAKEPTAYYEHSEVGYNYRLSNLLAAIGRAQLEVLEKFVEQRRANYHSYKQALAGVPGISFMPEILEGRSSRWLTCITIDPEQFGATREEVRLALEAENIESRPVWKPMHLQPIYRDCRVRGGGVAEQLFQTGLCLPSGSNLSHDELLRTANVIRKLAPTESAAMPLLETRS
ncbi:MAG: ATP-grasp domain-containing protein [Planctomycetales bacterium]|nr:ATP-grasp domain-containing protein [Planctomycetales bacterium]